MTTQSNFTMGTNLSAKSFANALGVNVDKLNSTMIRELLTLAKASHLTPNQSADVIKLVNIALALHFTPKDVTGTAIFDNSPQFTLVYDDNGTFKYATLTPSNVKMSVQDWTIQQLLAKGLPSEVVQNNWQYMITLVAAQSEELPDHIVCVVAESGELVITTCSHNGEYAYYFKNPAQIVYADSEVVKVIN